MSQAGAATVARGEIETAAQARRRSKRALRALLMLGGIAAVAGGALGFWLTGGRYAYTDDAYVRAALVPVTTDVSGLVGDVLVHEGEHVKKGQVLFRLDPRQFEIAVAKAKAQLAETALEMEALKRTYRQMQHQIEAKAAEVENDQVNFNRYANLVKTGGVTRSQYDDARFKLIGDQQALESLKAEAESVLAKLGGNPDIDVTQTPQYLEAAAVLAEAERELDHSVVRAPFDGIVTRVDRLQPGQYLSASQGAFGLVSDEDVWVEAQPKETEITWVKPGDPVEVTVDTYPGRVWHGVVESIAPSNDSQFSLLPAQNSSGNWVKVVQRIPIRIRIERKPDDPPLRAGMSVETNIDTGHRRHLRDLLGMVGG
jgi:membrane fusion protein (multidrug efflux system)